MKKNLKYFYVKICNIFTKNFLIRNFGFLAVGERVRPNFLMATLDAVETSDFNIIVSSTFTYPLADSSLEVIYSSHNIEHYGENIAKTFFTESYRVLRVGGELLIEVPDVKLLYDEFKRYVEFGDTSIEKIIDWNYASKNVLDNVRKYQPSSDLILLNKLSTKFLSYISCYCDPPFIGDHTPVLIDEEHILSALKKMSMDDFFSWVINHQTDAQIASGGHCSAWYYEKLKEILEDIGFDVKLRKYQGSRKLHRFLVPDRRARSNYSFRVSAIKL